MEATVTEESVTGTSGIEQETPIVCDKPGGLGPTLGSWSNTIYTITRVQYYSQDDFKNLKRLADGLKNIFGDYPIPVSELSDLFVAMDKMAKNKGDTDCIDGFTTGPLRLSDLVLYTRDSYTSLQDVIKILDYWSMFLGRKYSSVPVKNISFLHYGVNGEGHLHYAECETLEITIKFNTKGYDGDIKAVFTLGYYSPNQDLGKYVQRIEDLIISYLSWYGLFPGVLKIGELDRMLYGRGLGYLIEMDIPQMTSGVDSIVYNIIKANMEGE